MSMYLPIVRRITSCGISARFSAQSVSITPSVGCSVAITKPVSPKNCRVIDQACSGVAFTTSQRSLPARAMRAVGHGGQELGRARPRRVARGEARCGRDRVAIVVGRRRQVRRQIERRAPTHSTCSRCAWTAS
jgi:hypothetical protein